MNVEEIIIRCDSQHTIELCKECGIWALWQCSKDFEILSSACITLTELRERWPGATDTFIQDNIGINSNDLLLIAGLVAAYESPESYLCRPISGHFHHLSYPKEHPDYDEHYNHSYQAFAYKHKITEFVLPLESVEKYEKKNPDVRRKRRDISSSTTAASENTVLQEVLSSLSRLPQSELAEHRGACLAELLATVGVPAKMAYPLITGKSGLELNSCQTGVRRFREKYRDLVADIHKHEK